MAVSSSHLQAFTLQVRPRPGTGRDPAAPWLSARGTQTDLGPRPLPSSGAAGLGEGPRAWQPGPVSENPGVPEARSAAPHRQGHRPAGRPREMGCWVRSPEAGGQSTQPYCARSFQVPQGPPRVRPLHLPLRSCPVLCLPLEGCACSTQHGRSSHQWFIEGRPELNVCPPSSCKRPSLPAEEGGE